MGGQTNAINSSGQTNGKKATVSFPRLFLSHPHLLRSVTAGFSQSLAWLGWDAPSLPDAVGGSGREVIVFFFLVASSSGSTSVDDDSDDGRAAGKRREETTLLAFFLLVAALFCSSLLAVDARRHRQLSR